MVYFQKFLEKNRHRSIELEIRPIFLIPDTNCFIDYFQNMKNLLESEKYTIVIPLTGELRVKRCPTLWRQTLYYICPVVLITSITWLHLPTWHQDSETNCNKESIIAHPWLKRNMRIWKHLNSLLLWRDERRLMTKTCIDDLEMSKASHCIVILLLISGNEEYDSHMISITFSFLFDKWQIFGGFLFFTLKTVRFKHQI